jgi:hypothetical protein
MKSLFYFFLSCTTSNTHICFFPILLQLYINLSL